MPEGKGSNRYETLSAFKSGLTELPEAEDVSYLLEIWGEIGIDGCDWQTIDNYLSVTKRALLPSESKALVNMTRLYKHELHKGSDPDSPPPFMTDETKKKVSAINEMLKEV